MGEGTCWTRKLGEECRSAGHVTLRYFTDFTLCHLHSPHYLLHACLLFARLAAVLLLLLPLLHRQPSPCRPPWISIALPMPHDVTAACLSEDCTSFDWYSFYFHQARHVYIQTLRSSDSMRPQPDSLLSSMHCPGVQA